MSFTSAAGPSHKRTLSVSDTLSRNKSSDYKKARECLEPKIPKRISPDIQRRVTAYLINRDGAMSPLPEDRDISTMQSFTVKQHSDVAIAADGSERVTTTRDVYRHHRGAMLNGAGAAVSPSEDRIGNDVASPRQRVTFSESVFTIPATLIASSQAQGAPSGIPVLIPELSSSVVTSNVRPENSSLPPKNKPQNLFKKIALVFLCAIAFFLGAILLKQNGPWLISRISRILN